MNHLQKNKKGLVLLIPIALFVLIATLMILAANFSGLKTDYPIGEVQYDLLKKSELLIHTQEYLGSSIRYASQQTEKDFFSQAGFHIPVSQVSHLRTPPCGRILYNSYTDKDKECFPDFQESYISYMQTYLREYIADYRQVKLFSHMQIEARQEEQKTHFILTTNNPLQIPLLQREEAKNIFERFMPQSAFDNIKTLQEIRNEKEIPCTTGNCFAQVTRALYQRHQEEPLSFVIGGVSPYTYEQTLQDKQERGRRSFFYEVELSEFQGETRKPTEPGFDQAGWLWWVGKHAGIKELSIKRSMQGYYEVAKTFPDVDQICGEITKENYYLEACYTPILANELEEGDILFISQNQQDIISIAIFVGDNLIIELLEEQGLVQRRIPSEYATETSSTIIGVFRFPYNQEGVESIEPEEVADLEQGFMYYQPEIHRTTPILFSNIELVKNFTKKLEENCKTPTTSCLIENINQFNKKYEGQIKISMDEEENAMALDILDQFINCYNAETKSCLCTIDINYNLPLSRKKFSLIFYEDGEVNLRLPAQQGSGFSFLPPELLYITMLDFNPTKMFFVDKTFEKIELHVDAELRYSYLEFEEVKWLFTQGIPQKTLELLQPEIKTIFDMQSEKLALYKQFSPKDLQRPSSSFGPHQACSGEETLSSTYQKQLYEPAWNSGGKSYLEIALEQAREQQADPAMLLTHAILESSMGLNNRCIRVQQSALTGCGWPGSDCTTGVRLGFLSHYIDSDQGQLECTAKVNKGAYLEVQTGERQDLSGGHYLKCQEYKYEPELFWRCIWCVYQGSYNEAIVGKGVDPTGKSYFTKDQTCEYAEKMLEVYCSVSNHLESLGVYAPTTTSYEGGCPQVVNYAKEYLGTEYASTKWQKENDLEGKWYVCSAEDAQKDICRTQCGSLITNIFRYTTTSQPTGKGAVKCDSLGFSEQKFIDSSLLLPGDVFASTGGNDAGHTGMYVGKGVLSEPDKQKSTCFMNFEPDPTGEHIFLHSIGPVCYTTLSQLQKTYKITSFCRHEDCGDLSYQPTSQEIKKITPLQWIPYEEESAKEFLCPSGQTNYRFQAHFPFTTETLNFALYLRPEITKEPYTPKIKQKIAGEEKTTLLFTWNISKSQENPHSFIIELYNQTSDFMNPNSIREEDNHVNKPLVQKKIPLASAKKFVLDIDFFDIKEQLVYQETQTHITYYYLVDFSDSYYQFDEEKTYGVVPAQQDMYAEKHYSDIEEISYRKPSQTPEHLHSTYFDFLEQGGFVSFPQTMFEQYLQNVKKQFDLGHILSLTASTVVDYVSETITQLFAGEQEIITHFDKFIYSSSNTRKTIDKIVIHYSVSRSAQETIKDLANRQSGSRASYHYLIDKDGTIHYLVDEEKSAWHAGCTVAKTGRTCLLENYNSRSIGVSFVNMGWLGNCTQREFDIKYHQEDKGITCYEEYTQEALHAGAKLIADISCRRKEINLEKMFDEDRNDLGGSLLGHEEVDVPPGKFDPGTRFPWEEFLTLAKNYYQEHCEVIEV